MPSKHFEMMGSTFFSTSENWQYPFARCRILCSSISCIFWWQTHPNDSLDPHPTCAGSASSANRNAASSLPSCLNISRWRSAVSPCSRRSSAPCCTSAAEPRNRSCFPLPCASGRGRGSWPSAWTTGGKRQKRRWQVRRQVKEPQTQPHRQRHSRGNEWFLLSRHPAWWRWGHAPFSLLAVWPFQLLPTPWQSAS